ncbi:PREDICTED: palmitoyltransferase ZDHHC3-like [Drosophila arizonae]|uniref:Palmitoyltransferase n=1 Tax=Drosophila arizonae TaxID=7263 RepID=A0ABM1NU90_DROAR|nr:PREDICTED: palmitoyltransferase ZDHHC3-like [Drosophila arizonae]
MVFIRDPCGIICLIATYGAVIYADYVVICWIIPATMPLSIGVLQVVLFNAVVFLLAMSHSKAAFSDPGFVLLPAKRLDFSDLHSSNGRATEWTLCTLCEIYRPPQAHHCTVCQRCIRRMDHHCPCINNCVGECNQKYFLQFLFYGGILCLYSVALVLVSWIFPCTECSQSLIETQLMHTIVLMMESTLFGLFVTLVMLDQLSVILYDETVFEAREQKGAYWSKNRRYQMLAKVFGPGHPMLWLLPRASLNDATSYHDAALLSHEV